MLDTRDLSMVELQERGLNRHNIVKLYDHVKYKIWYDNNKHKIEVTG